MRYEGGQYYVKSPREMADLFPNVLEALENTHKIAQRCHVEIEFGVTKLPKFDVPEGYTSWEYLNKLCFEGLSERYDPVTEELTERLNYELNTIKNMGYVDYFLIVWDFIKYARDHDIMVGPGRGSAAGSLVAYSLGITKLDPIRYDLLFERFLNPERVSMPDIDVDFCFERRQEVIDYVVRKYGKNRVVQIVTFGTLAARGVIRDVGRVLDLPYAQVDTIAKMVPQELNITIDKALDMNPELKKAYNEQNEIHYLIDMAKRLEGLPRHTSMHAAGVVISQKDVDEYVPLSRSSDGSITTQFTMTTLEELGLLKMDFLGLRTLTVIQNAQRLVEQSTGIRLDMDHIDYDDKKVLDSLGTGHADGVFQLESAGMKSFMKELKPQSLEDVIAGISLYRPGPMDFIPQYIRGKNRPDTIRYDCPQLESILKPTYGCIVYQEQVMQIVRSLAGYTLGRSDLVRRAMSKKKASVMEKERQNFVYGNPEEGVPGCIANGISEQVANKIYDDMTDFAKYAFNKSHAAAYAVVSYQTAYLKYYYPVEFMAALMTSVIEMPTKVAEYIQVCRQMGIKILSPDINSGMYGFSVDNGSIRYGLSAIKSVGRPVIEAIVKEREENGLYRSLKDFIERLSGSVNKRAIENFIKAGALDCLEGNRHQKMMVYAQIAESINQDKKHTMAGQMSLFDLVSEEEKKEYEIQMPKVDEYEKETLLAYEKEVLGIYLSGHPLERYQSILERTISARTIDFQPDEETGMPKVTDNQKVIVGGMITERTVKYTRNNQAMAFLTLEDLVGTVEIVVFPRDYEKYQSMLIEDARVLIQGRVSAEDDKASKLIFESVRSFDEIPRELWVQFANRTEYASREAQFLADLKNSPGKSTVVVYLKDIKAMKKLGSTFQISFDETWMASMRKKYGEDNVKVVERVLKNFRK
jgi:DNA polymerase-3 subunit alpha